MIDTSGLNVHQLVRQGGAVFGAPTSARALRIAVMSFGFKYGLRWTPTWSSTCASCRTRSGSPSCARTPAWTPVRDYVLGQPGASEFLDAVRRAAGAGASAGYLREGSRYVTLAVGCTGGKHRSVAIAEELASRLSSDGVGDHVVHRDLGRE